MPRTLAKVFARLRLRCARRPTPPPIDHTQDFDAIFGADQSTINSIIAAIYEALKPTGIFQPTIKVNEVDISTVDVNIKAAFAVTLSAPPHLLNKLNAAINSHSMPSKNAFLMLAATTPISITISAPSVDVKINYSTRATPTALTNCALSVGALLSTNASKGTLTVHAASAVVDTRDGIMDEIVNNAVVPFLLEYLNKNILMPIRIPSLSFKDLTVSLPAPSIQSPFLLGSTSLGTIQPKPIPIFSNWPPGKFFIAVDATLISAAANAALPLVEGRTFSWTSFTGNYSLRFGPVAAVQIKPDASIQATITALATFNITFHTPHPFPDFSWSPSAQTTVTANASTTIANSELVVTYHSLSLPSFAFDWNSGSPTASGSPEESHHGWVGWLLDPLLDGLGDTLGALVVPIVNEVLKGHKFNVVNIPTIAMETCKVTLGTVETTYLLVGEKSLLVAEGIPSVDTISPTSFKWGF